LAFSRSESGNPTLLAAKTHQQCAGLQLSGDEILAYQIACLAISEKEQKASLLMGLLRFSTNDLLLLIADPQKAETAMSEGRSPS